MASPTPIKRYKALQPLSREHHQGLLLCWKIKKGISKSVAPERIADYVNWFYEHYLKPHFEVEERQLFPILGNEHPMVKQALAEHQHLMGLILNQLPDEIETFGIALEQHIRFEERQLFNELQTKASADELSHLEKQLDEADFCLTWDDPFWK